MADENTDPPKKKSPIMLILAGVFGGVILVGGGLGAGYFLFGGNQPLPEDIAQDIIASKAAGEAAAEGGVEGEGEPEIDCPVEEELEEGEEMPEECLGPEEKVSKDVPSEELFETMYYEFPATMTTNLKGSRRFLQVGIGISTQYDETVIENIEAHMPALTAEILATLSDYTEEEVAGREARFALAEDLRTTMNTTLTELEGFGGIEKVHLTSYVRQ